MTQLGFSQKKETLERQARSRTVPRRFSEERLESMMKVVKLIEQTRVQGAPLPEGEIFLKRLLSYFQLQATIPS